MLSELSHILYLKVSSVFKTSCVTIEIMKMKLRETLECNTVINTNSYNDSTIITFLATTQHNICDLLTIHVLSLKKITKYRVELVIFYSKCSKILNTCYQLPKWPRQTVQTKTRLLDQGLPCLLI